MKKKSLHKTYNKPITKKEFWDILFCLKELSQRQQVLELHLSELCEAWRLWMVKSLEKEAALVNQDSIQQ